MAKVYSWLRLNSITIFLFKMISTNAADYVAGITTYSVSALSDIKGGTISTTVSYVVGTGVTYQREVNIPWNGNTIDDVEWDSRLGDHLFSINNRVNIGMIKTTT